METIGFIGVYDKTDLLLNVSKILTTMGKKVLMVDSTVNQKAKYVVPFINPTTSYVTNFEDIDVAVGFRNVEQIKQYLGITEALPYDIMLVDADTTEKIEEFELKNAKKNFFVTAFDVYSLKKGLEILAGMKDSMDLIKVLFSKELLSEEEEYLNFLSLGMKIVWSEYKVYFPLENGDLTVLMENQRVEKIKMKRLSAQYKEGLIAIVSQIEEDQSESAIRKAIKTIEKGV